MLQGYIDIYENNMHVLENEKKQNILCESLQNLHFNLDPCQEMFKAKTAKIFELK